MPDKTTRRLDVLERHLEARGPQVDVSWMTDIVAEVYGVEGKACKVTMREEDYQELERTVLKIFGAKLEVNE